MKKIILLLAFAMAPFANADRSRLDALNQDVNGSYYLLDSRNIFLNPAQVNLLKNAMNFEWGAQSRPGVANYPNAEGGMDYSLGVGVLAVQLGRIDDFSRRVHQMNGEMGNIANNVTGGNTFGEGQNNLDVIYGGSAGDLRWGGGLGVTRSKNAVGGGSHLDSNVQAYDLRGGVYTDRWEGYGSLLLGGKSETDQGNGVTAKFDESFGLRVGGGFQVMPEVRVFGHVAYDKYEASLANQFDYSGKRTGINAGAAYVHGLDNNARMFMSAELAYLSDSASDSFNNPTEKYNYWYLPLTMGVEGDANTWLRLRASVRQNVLLGNMTYTASHRNGDVSYFENAPNDTSVGFGAGTTLNAFNFDVALLHTLDNTNNGRIEGSLAYMF